MSRWSLPTLLAGLHDDIEQRLSTARKTLAHPTVKGDASETVWLELLQAYLPKRYRAARAHVVDSKGVFSEQIDILIFDQQYSPLIFSFEGQMIVPAESVYAVLEAKQTADAALVRYAQRKTATVRQLHRTSQPIPHAGGTYEARPLQHIIGGLLTLESEWKPPLSQPLHDALAAAEAGALLDIGCIAAHGTFAADDAGGYTMTTGGKPATTFLFELIARLQSAGTVPMIDTRAYAHWLT